MSGYRAQAPAELSSGVVDGDYDYQAASNQQQQQQPSAAMTPTRDAAAGLSTMMAYTSIQDAKRNPPPPPPPQPRGSSTTPPNNEPNGMMMAEPHALSSAKSGDEALLDLAQLEELQQEAERMKALGNKHMAAQEFTRAYNAYSAALQLAPVGPSSHVFLSNRAAALLSLKRYSAAATDARRAIALAPTFGKAHARLGQALYFCKDYGGAIAAYEDALHYEPDNAVTQTYLEKAKLKQEKHAAKIKNASSMGSGEVSLAGETFLTTPSSHSITTSDPQASQNAVLTNAYQGRHVNAMQGAVMAGPDPPSSSLQQNRAAVSDVTPTVAAAAAPQQQQQSQPPGSANSSPSPNRPSVLASRMQQQAGELDNNGDQPDPDFEESLKIQQRANAYLTQKKYKSAIEEYTAALFLVPDDIQLSSDLHLGRAHALNGSRRHESATNDCMLAIKLNPSPAAYSTLAKSLFYMRDYAGSIEAFDECVRRLPPTETLGLFDQAYYAKAEAAVAEGTASLSFDEVPRSGSRSIGVSSSKSPVPKLPPPRFVPREQAIHTTTTVPPMPKEWPQQSAVQVPLKVGPERQVLCLSESLGVKLNRGTDGIVRILAVTPESADSHVARQGEILQGDVLREAASVDLRRPITNIMWGDTVALIKMAPRPIALIVAQELSPVPPAVLEEQRKIVMGGGGAMSPNNSNFRPSPSSGDEAVAPPANNTDAAPSGGTNTDDVSAPATAGSSHTDNNTDVVQATTDMAAPQSAGDAPTSTTPTSLPADSNSSSLLSDAAAGVSSLELKNDAAEQPSTGDDDNRETVPDNNSEIMENQQEQPEEEANAKQRQNNDDQHDTQTDGALGANSQQVSGQTADERRKDASVDEDGKVSVTSAMVAHSLLDDDEDGDNEEDAGNASEEPEKAAVSTNAPTDEKQSEDWVEVPNESTRERELRMVGGEIMFMRNAPPGYCGWDSLRWLSYSGVRRVQFCQPVYRLVETKAKPKLFWQAKEEEFVERALLIYDEPQVILVVRRPSDLEQVAAVLDLDDVSEIEDPESALHSYWVVESVADPATTKLRLSTLTTVTVPCSKDSSERAKSCFTLVTPLESIALSAVRVRDEVKKAERSFSDSGAFLETSATESAISKALYNAHEQQSDLGNESEGILWKHQLVLGSLHSFVVSGNQSALEEAIASAQTRANDQPQGPGKSRVQGHLPERIVDLVDDNGLTPLYYACSLGMSAAVGSLVKAGANVNILVEADNSTLLHVCARNLDDKSLSTILSCSRARGMNPNAFTSYGRSPMYVAAVEGRSSSGMTDALALRRCLVALKAWGGEMNPNDVIKTLAVTWRHEDLQVVLEHSKYRYPLPMTDVSMSAFHLYPLHHAMLSLLGYFENPASSYKSAQDTLRILFDYGFEPNERLDAPLPVPDDFPAEFVGYTTLQILAFAALSLEKSKEIIDSADYTQRSLAIADLAELIVRAGGRVAVDAPVPKRPRSMMSTSSLGSESLSDAGSSRSMKALSLSTKQIFELLGGEPRLEMARKCWANEKSAAVGLITIMADNNSVFANADGPGASDEKSCATCWKVFGSLRNRRHKCRVSRRYVCDDCSSKRLVDNSGAEQRISDGQFLLAKADATRKEMRRRNVEAEKSRSVAGTSAQARGAARDSRLEAEQTSNRESLFGGMMEQASNFVFGESEETEPSNQLQGLNQSLNQTRDALNERGEKLASLDEKTSEMVNASADFARMAKELRKKSEGGLFW